MKKAMIASVLAILAASAFAQSFASLSGGYVFALQSEPGRDSKGRIVTDRTASHSAVFGYDLFLGDTFGMIVSGDIGPILFAQDSENGVATASYAMFDYQLPATVGAGAYAALGLKLGKLRLNAGLGLHTDVFIMISFSEDLRDHPTFLQYVFGPSALVSASYSIGDALGIGIGCRYVYDIFWKLYDPTWKREGNLIGAWAGVTISA